MLRSTLVVAALATFAFACTQSTEADDSAAAVTSAAKKTVTKYAVTNITDDSGGENANMYCLQLPAAVFGQVGNAVSVTWSKSGVDVDGGGDDGFSAWNFFVGHEDVPYMGGVDHYTGKFTSVNALTFVDVQDPGGGGPYYTVDITRAGDTVTIETVAGAHHVCTLTAQ